MMVFNIAVNITSYYNDGYTIKRGQYLTICSSIVSNCAFIELQLRICICICIFFFFFSSIAVVDYWSKSIEVDKDELKYDLGHLCAYDYAPVDVEQLKYPEYM